MPFPTKTLHASCTDVVVASAAQVASGNSGVLSGYGPGKLLRVQLDVTAVAGTAPTLNVIVEDTLDGTTFNTIGPFAQATSVGRQVTNITAPFANRLRVSWTITGSAGQSFTFSVVLFAEA